MIQAPAHPRSTRVAVLLLLCGLAGSSEAQSVADRLEEADRILPDVVRAERVVMPTRQQATQPISPGLTGGSPWDNAGVSVARLPEGTFLIERPGRLVPAPGGRSIFIPDNEDRLPGEGPMLALPNAALDRLEITLNGSAPALRVSGEVFVYQDRRYLMITSFQIGPEAAPNAEPAEPDPGQSSDEGVEPTIESLLDDPEVRGLLEELEAEAPPPARVDRDQQPTAPVVATGQPAPAPDGTPVFRRSGRMVRSGSGAWLFIFDNDTDDQLGAASMTLLPCRLLERIERDAQNRGDAAQVALSGRVYVHQGQAYLLPTMMTRVTTTGIVPMR